MLIKSVMILLVCLVSGVCRADGSIPVIDRLQVGTLAPGLHQFLLELPAYRQQQPELVPVLVMKGVKPGKRLTLTAAVHGNEINGIEVIHRLLEKLDAEKLAGTLVAVPGVNRSGLASKSRYVTAAKGAKAADLNRAFPGGVGANGFVRHVASELWQRLLLPNTDLAVDIHTQAVGARYPYFIFADFRNEAVQEMAFALGPDIIKDDAGQRGSLETAYLDAGIPAVTLEIGGPEQIDHKLAARAVDGLRQLMLREGMLDVESAEQKRQDEPFVGRTHHDLLALRAGPVDLLVELGERVDAGAVIARQSASPDAPVQLYRAPVSGIILAVSTDLMPQKDAFLLRILN